MDSLINVAKSLPNTRLDLTPKNVKTHKYPTTSIRLLNHAISTIGE